MNETIYSADEKLDTVPIEVRDKLLEEGIVIQPKVIHDGEKSHTHYYIYRGIDTDGNVSVMCSGCIMGNTYNPKTHQINDGTIVLLDK